MNLEYMERLEKSATKGPWIADHAVHIGTGIKTRAIYAYPTETRCIEIVESPDELKGECIHSEADWEFIAIAREFVPWAIDRIRYLERSSERLKEIEARALNLMKNLPLGTHAPGWHELMVALGLWKK